MLSNEPKLTLVEQGEGGVYKLMPLMAKLEMRRTTSVSCFVSPCRRLSSALLQTCHPFSLQNFYCQKWGLWCSRARRRPAQPSLGRRDAL